MRAIATDGVALSVCVCVSVGHVREPAQMAELIEMPFGELTRMGPKNHH